MLRLGVEAVHKAPGSPAAGGILPKAEGKKNGLDHDGVKAAGRRPAVHVTGLGFFHPKRTAGLKPPSKICLVHLNYIPLLAVSEGILAL